MSARENSFFDYQDSKPRRADMTISIFIADSNDEFRAGMQKLLQLTPGLRFVGQTANGPDAVWQAASIHPQVMLIRAGLRAADGSNAIKAVKELLPDCKVVALIDPSSDEEICSSIAAGADGCCSGKVFSENVKAAVTSVFAGNTWYDPVVRSSLERACSRGLKFSEPPQSLVSADEELDNEVARASARLHRPRWHQRRKWITSLHWFMVALFAGLILLSTGPLVKAVLDSLSNGHSNNSSNSVGGPTAAIPGIAYTLFELQCRTWHRYRGTPAFNMTAN